MSKNVVLEIPESEVAKFEAALDQLLDELKRLEEQREPTWREIAELGDETRETIKRIRAKLDVEEILRGGKAPF